MIDSVKPLLFCGPARIRTWNPRIWSPMLCQLELLTLATVLRRRKARFCFSLFTVPGARRDRLYSQEILPSLCTVCARHFGQNFLIENLSVCVFLFLVVV